jgi:alcohol dehydrogenase class IV
MDKTGLLVREFRIPQNIIYGRGAINSLSKYVRDFGRVVLLVTGRKAMRSLGITSKIITQLSKENIKTVIFDRVEEDPCLETVDKGIRLAKEKNVDFVIGLGGGSALDAAKAIAGLFNEDCSVREFVLCDRPITKKGLKFVACPTTSGSGTEVTKNAVLTIKEIPAKKSIRHFYLIPALSIVDPELTLSLPKDYTAGCGMDALTHAIEAYTSINILRLQMFLLWKLFH